MTAMAQRIAAVEIRSIKYTILLTFFDLAKISSGITDVTATMVVQTHTEALTETVKSGRTNRRTNVPQLKNEKTRSRKRLYNARRLGDPTVQGRGHSSTRAVEVA